MYCSSKARQSPEDSGEDGVTWENAAVACEVRFPKFSSTKFYHYKQVTKG